MYSFENLKIHQEDTEVYLNQDIALIENNDAELLQDLDHDITIVLESFKLMNVDNSDTTTIKNSINQTYKLLGITTTNNIATEDLHLYQESFKNLFNKVIETFKNLWNRIKDFFKIAWTKIQVNYYNITKDIFNLRKYVYGLRDKSSIVVKKEDFEQFTKELGFFFIPDDVDGLETKQRVKEFINITQPENIESVFKLISNTIELYSKNTNKDIIIQDYKDKLNTLLTSFNKDVKNKILPHNSLLFKIPISQEETNIEYLVFDTKDDTRTIKKESQSISLNINNNTKEYYITVSMLKVLAELVDKYKNHIKQLSNIIFSSDKLLMKSINNVGDYDQNMRVLINDAMTISQNLTLPLIRNIISQIRVISKWVKKIVSYRDAQSVEGLKKLADKINKLPRNTETTLLPHGYIYDPEQVKLKIINKDIAYITLGEKDWKMLASIGLSVAFCKLNSSNTLSDLTNIAMITQNEKNEHQLEINNIGCIFINEEIDKMPYYESLLFKKLGINFIYYHELGHLLTGQHETIIPNNKIENSHIDKNKKFIFEGFRIYAYSLKENRADAYACLKTGMSPKKVAEIRRENIIETTKYGFSEEHINKTLTEYDTSPIPDDIKQKAKNHFITTTDEIRRDFLSNEQHKELDKCYDDMIKNIEKAMSEMKSYVKLSLIDYLKLSFRSKS